MHIPIATYRIQLNPSFGFQAVRGILSYLSELGISHVYASPIFKARRGSLHGYDVVDPNQLNPELGTIEDFENTIADLRHHGMFWLQDIVPNHMAYDSENELLMDVLENGEDSKYFNFFDIDWNHPSESFRGRVLSPFLGKFYADSLEGGEIQLKYGQRGLAIAYHDFSFPLKISSYVQVFEHNLGRLESRLTANNPDFIKFIGALYFLKTLKSKKEVNDQYDQTRHTKRILWELYASNEAIRSFLDENIEFFNGKRGSPESFNPLDRLLSEQPFRLSFWKVATEEINYRRFFNINELISVKVEEEDVFNYVHGLIFRFMREGRIDALRIDHIDGLYDPTAYLRRLRDQVGDAYIVVEKILGLKEQLPSIWPVQGTTGYEFLNYASGIFCNRENGSKFDKLYYRFTGIHASYEDLVCEKKRLIIGKHMAGDVDNLAQFIKNVSGKDRHGRDITLYGLRRALVEVMASFPVYRTHISHEFHSEADQAYVREALQKARERSPGFLFELNFIEKFLSLDHGDSLSDEEKRQWTHFVMKFQQYTGPLMAKGFEDTVLYNYNRLLSLNEVGGSPNRFGISVEEFHDFNIGRFSCWPHALNATSTHDVKRGEDVRARINVLSELPEEWASNLQNWSRINRKKKNKHGPDANDEYFLYQTLIGTFPFHEEDYQAYKQRIKQYLVKAIREAKVHTAWLKPDIDYEEACISFVEEILSPEEGNRFLRDFKLFQKKVAYYGIFNSLSQTLIKITSPGVPDFYQGTELWDFNLVDPDNRRPVDFQMRGSLLQEIKEKEEKDILNLISELLSNQEDGRIKLFLIHKALQARKARAELFQKGRYIPLEVGGSLKSHIISLARNHMNTWLVAIAPRFLTTIVDEGTYPLGEKVWKDTRVVFPDGAPCLWRDTITNQVIKGKRNLPVGEVLNHFPVALFESENE